MWWLGLGAGAIGDHVPHSHCCRVQKERQGCATLQGVQYRHELTSACLRPSTPSIMLNNHWLSVMSTHTNCPATRVLGCFGADAAHTKLRCCLRRCIRAMHNDVPPVCPCVTAHISVSVGVSQHVAGSPGCVQVKWTRAARPLQNK